MTRYRETTLSGLMTQPEAVSQNDAERFNEQPEAVSRDGLAEQRLTLSPSILIGIVHWWSAARQSATIRDRIRLSAHADKIRHTMR
jgi:hypothetical protein